MSPMTVVAFALIGFGLIVAILSGMIYSRPDQMEPREGTIPVFFPAGVLIALLGCLLLRM